MKKTQTMKRILLGIGVEPKKLVDFEKKRRVRKLKNKKEKKK